ncbi:hypothetical protein DOY81_002137, partial [Sarcophaga bullata]
NSSIAKANEVNIDSHRIIWSKDS